MALSIGRSGLELVRAMLRDNGAWCRLEAAGRFFVHVGYDQYVYVGSIDPCEQARERTRALGLFPERIGACIHRRGCRSAHRVPRFRRRGKVRTRAGHGG
ncbi:hypothetical protein ACFFMN_41930 [Planobispora siamensis]|uniref:hypothetical protein n=1 Tax=Planobispora siamensis TaxID=936338 RepID=UPI00194F81F9|nr:hypothetical protein [Planobispora siamensis]